MRFISSPSSPISDGSFAPDSPERALRARIAGPTTVCHSLDRERYQPWLLLLQSETRLARYARSVIGERDDEDHMKGAYVRNAAVVGPSDFAISGERNDAGQSLDECVQAKIQSAA